MIKEYETAIHNAKQNPRIQAHVLQLLSDLQTRATMAELNGDKGNAERLRNLVLRLYAEFK